MSDRCRAFAGRGARRARHFLAHADRYDIAAGLLLVALLVLVGITFRDYGISNDEGLQQRYGELIVAYYTSGFVDQAVFNFRNLYLYGGLFDLAAVGLEKLLPLDTYAVRHLLSGLAGVGGIAMVWATARTIAGPRAGLLAAAALAVCGTWYGAMFNHTKDIPFAATMMAATYVLILIGRELPRPRWHLVAMFGVLCGCALGIRVLGLFLLSYAALVVVMNAPQTWRANWREPAAFAMRSAIPLAGACVIAYLIMIATWPWSALAPLNPLRAMSAFIDFHYPIQTMLFGHVYHMADVPRWYVVTYIGIKLTLWLLGGAGLALALAALPHQRSVATNPAATNSTWWQDTLRKDTWRKETALIAFTAFFPLICNVIIAGPAFTGMRHFLFTVPSIAVLAGIGLDGGLDRLRVWSRPLAATAMAAVVLGLGWNAVTLYRLHPDEYLYFNPLVGGLEGASRRYDTDYWVNIMPEAVTDLERFIDHAGGVQTVGQKPRHFRVLVCSEPVQFEKEADDRFEWTRDRQTADFFIAPTNMNCDRAVDGKVVATIERLGVVIGVVKDRRAIIRPNVAGLN
jgi:hypothetical protein